MKLFIYLLLFICSFESYAQTIYCSKISNEIILNKKHIVISYDNKFNIPYYVGEELTYSISHGNVSRRSSFISEPSVTNITHKSFSGSGFDRGHLAPAADFRGSYQGMFDCYSICNVAMQDPKLNRNYWMQLEELVRKQTTYCDKVYVITGTIISPSIVPYNDIYIPIQFWKAIIGIKDNKKVVSCAWIYNNDSSVQTVESTKCTIHSLEKILGYDLFPKLNKKDHNVIEHKMIVY